MRRLIALALVAAACGAPGGPSPQPASELLFIPGAAVRVVDSRSGALVATLSPGAFDAHLSAGGDVDEAYVVGDGVHRVRAGRPFRDERVADATGRAPFQVALVPAPSLTTYVGRPSVLVTLSADGRLAGYQAGARIWERAVPGAVELRRADGLAGLRTGDDWLRVSPETGATSPLAAGCPAGPLAEVGGRPVLGCAGGAGSVAVTPPAGAAGGAPWVLHPVRQDVTVLAWPDGSWVRLPGAGRVARGAGGGRPALSADGSRLDWPAEHAPASALAGSRDGAFLYAVGGGRLRVLRRPGGQVVVDVALDATDIALVAGG